MNKYKIMKTTCALGNRMHGSSFAQVYHAVHHMPNCISLAKCMSRYKTIVVITGKAHCFHDCTYIIAILLL